jgi:hypothetical protein
MPPRMQANGNRLEAFGSCRGIQSSASGITHATPPSARYAEAVSKASDILTEATEKIAEVIADPESDSE